MIFFFVTTWPRITMKTFIADLLACPAGVALCASLSTVLHLITCSCKLSTINEIHLFSRQSSLLKLNIFFIAPQAPARENEKNLEERKSIRYKEQSFVYNKNRLVSICLQPAAHGAQVCTSVEFVSDIVNHL